MQKFEDIIAWQRARDLAVAIYKAFKNPRDLASISTNITNPDKFLQIQQTPQMKRISENLRNQRETKNE